MDVSQYLMIQKIWTPVDTVLTYHAYIFDYTRYRMVGGRAFYEFVHASTLK